MNVLFILAGFSLFLATGFLLAFLWSVKSGQYDDDHTPGMRILFDDSSFIKSQSKKLEINSFSEKLTKKHPLTAD